MRDTDNNRVADRCETGDIVGFRAAPLWCGYASACRSQGDRRLGIEFIDTEVMKEAQHLRVAPQQPRNEQREDGKADRLDNHKCGHATPLCGVRRNREDTAMTPARALLRTAATKKLTRS